MSSLIEPPAAAPGAGHAPINTVTRFFRHLDDGAFDALIALMHPKGVWLRQGEALDSAQTILAAMARRSPTRRVHHLLTNLYVEDCDHGVVVAGYMLGVQHDCGVPPTGPSPLQGIGSIRSFRAELRMTAQGWRIWRLESAPPSFVAAA